MKDRYKDGHADALMYAIDHFITMIMEIDYKEKRNPISFEEKFNFLKEYKKDLIDFFEGYHGEEHPVYVKKLRTKKYGPYMDDFMEHYYDTAQDR